MTEVDEKVERAAHMARVHRLDGVLVTRQPNFAWLSGGQSNRIDGSVDIGAGSLFVTAAGGRYIVANTIEMPRLFNEALRGLGFEPIEYPWTRDHADAAAPAAAVHAGIGSAAIGADVPSPRAIDVSHEVAAMHTPLTDAEIERYRALGGDVGLAVEQMCRALRPGSTEHSIAARIIGSVAQAGARAIVTLVAADERIAQYRHPVPTSKVWTHTLLIGLCAERDGLVVALSRIISVGSITAELSERTAATAAVFGRLLAATRPGVTGADLFAIAADAYRAIGHPGQEALHHQGGAIGYRSRDWIAHPLSRDTVQPRQAFAWNPSITGTKVEDTALLLDDAVEILTLTPEWPSIEVTAGGCTVHAAGILVI